MITTEQELSTKLKSSKSSDRRQAAKSIGKLGLKELGPDLLSAFINEKKDSRTWETKVEMILSLGLIDYKLALPEVELIVNTNASYDMVTYAAAQTFVRLKRMSFNDASPVIALLKFGGLSLVSGALNSLGADRMMPSDNAIVELLRSGWDLHKHPDRIVAENGYLDPRIGLVVASAGWNKKMTEPFLNHCLATSAKDTLLKTAVEYSLKGKYKKLG